MPATNAVGQVWGEREGSDTSDILEINAFSEGPESVTQSQGDNPYAPG